MMSKFEFNQSFNVQLNALSVLDVLLREVSQLECEQTRFNRSTNCTVVVNRCTGQSSAHLEDH